MNNTIKKLIGLILIAANIISVFGLTAIAETEEVEFPEAVRVMEALGVMETGGDEAVLNKEVTRGEFVKYLAGVLKVNSSENPNVYFSDVPKSDPYCGVLASLYEMNIIQGSPSGNFEPQRAILYEEAYKMVVESCGYGDLAKLDGGYPMGYISTARRFGILAEGVTGGSLNFAECAEILYCASTNNLYSRTYGSGKQEFYEGDETLLSMYHHIYTYEGELQSVFGASIIDSSQIESGSMVIGGKLFKTEGDAAAFEDAKYLGSQIRGLYRREADDICRLFYIWEYDNNDSLSISAEDFSGYKNYTLTYLRNNRTRTVTIDKGAVHIHNGMRVDDNISSLYDTFKKGSVTLKKVNGAASYNLVLMKSYENFVIGSYGSSTQTLVEYNNPQNTIKLTDYDFIKLYDGGLAVDTLSYSPETVLTVAKQGSAIEIHKNNQTVSGKIEAIGANGTLKVLSIGEERYEVDKDYFAESQSKIKVGANCLAKLDLFGRIAYIDFDISSEWLFAYLLRVGYKEGDFGNGENVLECYTQNGEFSTFYFADKVVFDGNIRKGTENLTVYYPDPDLTDNQIPMQMLRYKLNGEGKINAIDTTSPYGDAETTIREYGTRTGKTKIYAPNMGLFFDGNNNQIAVDEKTLVMEVPGLENSYSDISKRLSVYFNIYPVTKLNAPLQRRVEGYAVGDEDIAPIVILVAPNIENEDYVETGIIFDSLGQDTTADGEVYTTINGYSFKGAELSYLIAEDAVFTNISSLDELSESDVIGIKTYTRDEKTFIRIVQKIYSDGDINRNDPKTAWGWTGFTKDKMAWQNIRPDYSNFILGDVVKIKGNMLHLSTPGGEKVVELYNTTKAPIFVYDKNETRNKFYVGSLADVQAALTHGGQGSRVIIRRNLYTPEGLFVYK